MDDLRSKIETVTPERAARDYRRTNFDPWAVAALLFSLAVTVVLLIVRRYTAAGAGLWVVIGLAAALTAGLAAVLALQIGTLRSIRRGR